ncbi:MAG: alpha/beta hydrolase [Chitinophagaceae bacterium]
MNLISLKFFTTILLLSTANIAIAQATAVPTINQKREHVLTSTVNGTTYSLFVSLPMRYAANDTTFYPVLYVLDGGLSFPIVHAARTSLDLFGDLEDVIIVALEYNWQESFKPWMTGRWKDFTPSKNEKADANPAYIKTYDLPAGSLTSGGAPGYVNALRKDIIPFIDKQYRTNNDRGISGHSLGGLFAAYCIFTAPDLFHRYGINSPSLWWNDLQMFKTEKSFSEQHQSLPVRVFLSVGELEGKSMTPVMTAFADSLKSRNYKDLHLTTHIFESETHMSVVPAMISRMLVVLYGKNRK